MKTFIYLLTWYEKLLNEKLVPCERMSSQGVVDLLFLDYHYTWANNSTSHTHKWLSNEFSCHEQNSVFNVEIGSSNFLPFDVMNIFYKSNNRRKKMINTYLYVIAQSFVVIMEMKEKSCIIEKGTLCDIAEKILFS